MKDFETSFPACDLFHSVSLETGCEQLELKWRDLGRVMKKGPEAINLIFTIPEGTTSIAEDHFFQAIYCTDPFKNIN